MDYTVEPKKIDPEKVLGILSIEDAKIAERVMHNREDTLIRGFILSAFDYLDGPNGYLNGYAILEREFTLYLPGDFIEREIMLRPLQEESLQVGTLSTDGYADVAADGYSIRRVDDCYHFRVTRSGVFGRTAPVARGIRLTFKAGHADPEEVPEGIRQAMQLLVGHWYQNREAAIADPRAGVVSRQVVFGVKALTRKYRLALDHDI